MDALRNWFFSVFVLAEMSSICDSFLRVRLSSTVLLKIGQVGGHF